MKSAPFIAVARECLLCGGVSESGRLRVSLSSGLIENIRETLTLVMFDSLQARLRQPSELPT